MNITIEALESYLSDRYGGCSIVKSSPVVSTITLESQVFSRVFLFLFQKSDRMPAPPFLRKA